MALDHLGVIAARIRSSTLKFQSGSDETARNVKPLDDVSAYDVVPRSWRQFTFMSDRDQFGLPVP